MKMWRILAGGVLWAALYNAVWALAWFVFMRREWEEAFAAVGKPLAWTATVWLIWVIVTIPLGAAVMAYAEGRPRRYLASLRGSVVLIVPMVIGLSTWGLQESLSARVLALDALVNVLAMPLAALAAVATANTGLQSEVHEATTWSARRVDTSHASHL